MKRTHIFEETMRIASPCIKLCRICPESGWCLGCHRSLDEIVRWGQAGDEERRQILVRVAERAAGALQAPPAQGASA